MRPGAAFTQAGSGPAHPTHYAVAESKEIVNFLTKVPKLAPRGAKTVT
jgi:hypothetical protein